ncbi:hypothetical protein RR48_02935 [Papilio machaon]|uniref:Uncharacterized protein n=1 Tax=Papilio machaon TaxID=76193 RepID=A0A0N1PIJ9_PAPMA|nr:hypothetical protein RR48_02935 [Papilio machaon]
MNRYCDHQRVRGIADARWRAGGSRGCLGGCWADCAETTTAWTTTTRSPPPRELYHENKREEFVQCSTDSAGFASANEEEEVEASPLSPVATSSCGPADEEQFAANIDLRYGGQYLTPEQLPEFCNQLHHLVEVIRNIQSYAKVTGEYPSELEKRLEQEAREVAALACEARQAREVVARTRTQRRALHALKKQLTAHLATLRHTEIRELEGAVRVSDRKLYKSWEALKDSTDPAAFEPLLEEIKSKQTALECLVRLINNRRAGISRAALAPHPLPHPLPHPCPHPRATTMVTSPYHRPCIRLGLESATCNARKRHDIGRRATHKRRKRDSTREPRSVPLSGETSRHGATVTVTVGQPTSDLTTTRASVRDILFFTSS